MKIFKKLYQRYKDMGSLPWIVCIVLLSVIAYYTVPVIGLIQAGGDERLLGWAYVCNLLALVVLCVNILRLDCRNLLSQPPMYAAPGHCGSLRIWRFAPRPY